MRRRSSTAVPLLVRRCPGRYDDLRDERWLPDESSSFPIIPHQLQSSSIISNQVSSSVIRCHHQVSSGLISFLGSHRCYIGVQSVFYPALIGANQCRLPPLSPSLRCRQKDFHNLTVEQESWCGRCTCNVAGFSTGIGEMGWDTFCWQPWGVHVAPSGWSVV